MAKKKKEKIDGMSPTLNAKIRSAVRQVWQRSHARNLCKVRCLTNDGFPFCEECGSVVAKIQVDHIVPVGNLLVGGILRMFCPSTGLKGLCAECHKIKTKRDKEKGLT